MTKGFVYCIGEKAGGPVKIGHAVDPQLRLVQLQTGNHAELQILGCIKGGRAVEGSVHAKFSALRIREEWFMDCGKAVTRFFAGEAVHAPTVTPSDLLEEVLAFLPRAGMTRADFGRAVANDLGFVQRLAAGIEPRRATVEKVRSFIAKSEVGA